MTQFIYAWYYQDDQPLLIVSELDYFEAEGAMNDNYSSAVLEELELVLDELDLSELTESTYELGSLSQEEVNAHLRELENFSTHEEFSSFIGS